MQPTSRNLVSQPAFLEALEQRQMLTVAFQQDQAVRIETNVGRITILFNPEGFTPLTTDNFLKYVNTGRYNNTVAHRLVKDFVVQFGGYELKNSFPHVKTFPAVVNEFDGPTGSKTLATQNGSSQVNVRGTVAMAKLGNDPNSATSEWFINLSDNNASNLDNQNGGFTTFGRVIGASMHVADVINQLKTTNSSFLNSAFTDFPVVNGSNPVTISAARAQNVVHVDLNKGGVRVVTWTDERGSTGTIRLDGKGSAALTFVGGDEMKFTRSSDGSRVNITGNAVTLDDVSTSKTNQSSVLRIGADGSSGRTTNIGSINVAGKGGLYQIDGKTVQLLGDVIAKKGPVTNIDLQTTFRSSISTVGGVMNLKVGTAMDTSVTVTGGTLKSLKADKWTDSGELGTRNITAKNIGTIEVTGNFSSNLTATGAKVNGVSTGGDVDRVTVHGNVGSQRAATWAVAGNLKNVQVDKVSGLTLAVVKTLGDFSAREIEPFFENNSPTQTKITAKHITSLKAQSLSLVEVTGNKSIGSVDVSGLVDSSNIRSDKSIGNVRIGGSLTGSVSKDGLSTTPSLIYAGVKSTVTARVISKSQFVTKSNASIGTLSVGGVFANSNVAAPYVGSLDLGRVRKANAHALFGVTADKRVGHVHAEISTKTMDVPTLVSQAGVDDYFSRAKITPADRGDFNVTIV